MDSDELAELPPPPKRRRLVGVLLPVPRLSDLLGAFGAQKSHTSVSKMRRQGVANRHMRSVTAITYTESSDSTPNPSPMSGSSFGQDSVSSRTSLFESREDSEDELQRDHKASSDDELGSDNIHSA